MIASKPAANLRLIVFGSKHCANCQQHSRHKQRNSALPESSGSPGRLGSLPFSFFKLFHLHNVSHTLLTALRLASMAALLLSPSEAFEDMMLQCSMKLRLQARISKGCNPRSEDYQSIDSCIDNCNIRGAHGSNNTAQSRPTVMQC